MNVQAQGRAGAIEQSAFHDNLASGFPFFRAAGRAFFGGLKDQFYRSLKRRVF